METVSPPALGSRLSRFFRRFHVRRPTAEMVERWKALAEEGETLERVMAWPEWAVVERRKEVYQRMRDLVLHAPQMDEAQRYRASIEWTALQEWFRELRVSVREGQKAREALSKVKEPAQPL